MATSEQSKSRTKSKRRSMPARVNSRENLLEDNTSSSLQPTPPHLIPSDHHILDLMLNESFADLDFNDRNDFETDFSGTEAPSSKYFPNQSDSEYLIEHFGLSKSGQEEINNVLLSQDVRESLNTVKHVSLMALDSLLRQILADNIVRDRRPSVLISTPAEKIRTWRRRALSDFPIPDNQDFDKLPREYRNAWIRSQLLADIAQNATKLGNNGEMKEVPIQSCSPSPDVAKLNQIENQLKANSPIIPSDDYSLACTLAVLLGYLYRILELSSTKSEMENVPLSSNSQSAEEILQCVNDENIYTTLRNEVNNLQLQHSNNINKTVDASDERLVTWNEINRLMGMVASFCRNRSINDPPPRYSMVIDENNKSQNVDPPKYSSIGAEKTENEKTQRDLDNVLSAIERVYNAAPQLTNQRVELNYRQLQELSAATLSTAIQRLSRGRYEEQRAVSTSVVKYRTLNRLVEQINKSASRSFFNQRVELNPRQIRDFEAAKLNGVIERLRKNRMTDQDWHPPEQMIVQDLTRLTNELTKTNSPTYASQRFHLSPLKERDMFMNSVFKKVDKMGSHRMHNQDADPPAQRRERAFQEIEEIMDKLTYRFEMDNQRAIWSPKKP
ncbi:hypothetical protein G9A89_023504 [Geosiphon pyriformis]|nr:hypothetical protein G9A89_023504 [Geosiphon pyriformis]